MQLRGARMRAIVCVVQALALHTVTGFLPISHAYTVYVCVCVSSAGADGYPHSNAFTLCVCAAVAAVRIHAAPTPPNATYSLAGQFQFLKLYPWSSGPYFTSACPLSLRYARLNRVSVSVCGDSAP
jgi:hypothetical protein